MLSEIAARAAAVHGNVQEQEALCAELRSGDRQVAYRAAWVMTHLKGEDLEWVGTHRAELVGLAVSTPDTAIRRLLLTVLSHLGWTAEDVDPQLIDFLFAHAADPEESVGVRSVCMRLAYMQCRFHPELAEELRQVLLMIEPYDLKPAVKHARQTILRQLGRSR